MQSFSEGGLNSSVLQAIAEMGYETPTPIQQKVIPQLLTGNSDIVALAQTGTGKTAAFGLPLLTLLDFNSDNTQALILCPTRELCMQITRDLKSFAKYQFGVNVTAVYGGASIRDQITEIKRGSQIIVATPGRMVDLLSRKNIINLSAIKYVVLDEADEMLNMGFKEDLDMILSATASNKTTWLFSATMPDEVLRISRKYMHNPVELTAGIKNQGNENIEHLYYVVQAKDKYAALKRIADYNPEIFAIVFCRTKIETQQVADALIKDGYNADSLHGDLSQQQRDYVMSRYRSRSLQMLIATDVAARGIDVNDVSHVINYNLPDELENYIHRSGRTARAGKKGVSISIINLREKGKISQLEKKIKRKFTLMKIPNGFEVCERQLMAMIHKVHDVAVNEEAISKFMDGIYTELQDLSKQELIKRFVSLEFNRFLDYYKNAPDLNVDASRDDRSYDSRGGGDVAKLFLNIGKMDGLDNKSLASFIASNAGIDKRDIVWLNVKGAYSFFEVKQQATPKVIKAFSAKIIYQGRKVRLEQRGEQRKESRGDQGNKNKRSKSKGRR
ncbi:MAG TPA: DEAD/DEAH box helicase [Chitinophagales bacterium]|nr:DEAD/DEAH box helicase [Chitinophagales bacterium]